MAKNEDWLNRKWRPAMAWMYMVVCIADFLIFPIMWAAFKAYIHESVEPWEPLTLQGAGLFHMAMGAVLGIAAWSRGREKVEYYKSGYHDYDNDSIQRESYSQPFTNRRRPPPPDDELI